MKFLGFLIIFVSFHSAKAESLSYTQSQSDSMTLENYYNHLCGPRSFEVSLNEEDIQVVTAQNLLRFIANPSSYTDSYRQDLYEYYISLNGEEQIVHQAALNVLGVGYNEEALRENMSLIRSEVAELLRQYARAYIVPIQWNFCATAIELKPLISQYGCSDFSASDINYETADQFCENPYVY